MHGRSARSRPERRPAGASARPRRPGPCVMPRASRSRPETARAETLLQPFSACPSRANAASRRAVCSAASAVPVPMASAQRSRISARQTRRAEAGPSMRRMPAQIVRDGPIVYRDELRDEFRRRPVIAQAAQDLLRDGGPGGRVAVEMADEIFIEEKCRRLSGIVQQCRPAGAAPRAERRPQRPACVSRHRAYDADYTAGSPDRGQAPG